MVQIHFYFNINIYMLILLESKKYREEKCFPFSKRKIKKTNVFKHALKHMRI